MRNPAKQLLAAAIVAFGCVAALAQSNTYYGTGALNSNGGTYNSAFGYDSLYYTSGAHNSAFGAYALTSNTTGQYNTASGYYALWSNLTGEYNTANGSYALYSNTSGSNTAMGYNALYNETSGGSNTGFGYYSLYNTTTGTNNVGVGYQAGEEVTTGQTNIAIGYYAGYDNPADGSYNIDIGNYGSSSDSGVTRIGSAGSQSSFFAAGIYGEDVSGVAVYVDSNGQLGVESSSIRFKKDVQAMADASDGVYHLRPVTYRYKRPFSDGSDPIEYGLIAEEVAQVYPDLVARSADGQIQTVKYQKLVPMLLNEVQKQHQLLIQQEAEIQQLEKQTATLSLLEKRIAELETASPSSRKLEARLTTK